MAIVLFDTNIIIDNLAGQVAAADELSAYDDAVISSISWIEITCKMTPAEQLAFESFLSIVGIRMVHPDDDIMRRASALRRISILNAPKIAVPDCIIRATAESQSRIVITRNPADFGGEGLMVRVPYDKIGGIATNIKPVPA